MAETYSESVSLLRCPHCLGNLAGPDCTSCGTSFPSRNGQLDLRPRAVLTRTVPFEVTPVDPLWSSTQRQVDQEIAPGPLTLPSLIPRAPGGGGYALEIGVGSKSLRAEIESAGWTFVGIDYGAAGADYLADVHALPFDGGTFSLVVCSALLEHVRYPHLAVREMARVAAPGGTVIGAVAFLQPFHLSYFHMTHAAVRDSFRAAGLELTAVGRLSERFLPYLAKHSLLPRPFSLLLRALVAPADLLHTTLLKVKQVLTKRKHDGSIALGVGVVFAAKKQIDVAAP